MTTVVDLKHSLTFLISKFRYTFVISKHSLHRKVELELTVTRELTPGDSVISRCMLPTKQRWPSYRMVFVRTFRAY